MIDFTKLPLSITSFRDFADNAMVYVDKTDLIADLARYRLPIFLSRPRRFGKSTLVSTFHELFSFGLEKFKGLKIKSEQLWSDKTYKVIHLDLSKIKEDTGEISFNEALLLQLENAFLQSGFSELLTSAIKIPSQYFDIRMNQPDAGNLVLLIDEYDAPLTAVMGDKTEFKKRRKVLSNFFSTIKSYSGKFRFIFITGVTRYSNTSIFSAFNNILDISFNPKYGAITGYTQEELEHYFKDYLENAVIELNKELGKNKYTYKSLLEALKFNYDGYSFDEKCRHHVYNPWSILNFLNSPMQGFKSYWLETGGAKPALLVNYLNTFIDKKVKKTELVDYLNLEFLKRTNQAALSPTIKSIEDEDFPFFAILYQAGYFTVKKAEARFLFVGLPNLEVKEAFAELVIERITDKDVITVNDLYKDKITAALKSKDYKALKDEFNKILNEFSYESIVSFKESGFRDVYKVMLQILGFNTYTEYQTALGRSDLCFEDDECLYIMELKVIGARDKVEDKLKEAKTQIKEKRYGLRLKDKEVVTLAMVIINENQDTSHKSLREVAAIEEV